MIPHKTVVVPHHSPEKDLIFKLLHKKRQRGSLWPNIISVIQVERGPNLDWPRGHPIGIMSILLSPCYITTLLISLTRLLQHRAAVSGSWLPPLHSRIRSGLAGKLGQRIFIHFLGQWYASSTVMLHTVYYITVYGHIYKRLFKCKFNLLHNMYILKAIY